MCRPSPGRHGGRTQLPVESEYPTDIGGSQQKGGENQRRHQRKNTKPGERPSPTLPKGEKLGMSLDCKALWAGTSGSLGRSSVSFFV